MRDNRINEIKQDYDAIAVPKNLEERVKQGISRAKEEAQKKFYQKPVFWAKFGSCAVAAMAALTLITNFNAPIAQAMEKIPVLGSIVRVVSFRTYEENNDNMNAKISVPEIEAKNTSGEKNSTASKELNDKIKQYTDKIMEQYRADVNAAGGEGKEDVLTDYKVVTDNSRLFSIKIETSISAGSSDTFYKIYHLDKTTGKIISLDDIFQKGSGYCNVITKEIKRQMREQMAEDDQKMYSIDDTDMPENNWQGITKDANFYMNEQGSLTFLFDKYEAAPGYMGTPEFTIPQETIQNIINPEYFIGN